MDLICGGSFLVGFLVTSTSVAVSNCRRSINELVRDTIIMIGIWSSISVKT